MNRIIFILILITISGKYAFSQYTPGDVVLDFSGSYVEAYSSSGVTTSKYTSKNRALDLGFSIGLCISKNLTAGLGLQYGHINNETEFDFYYYQNFLLKEKMDTKATLFAPLFYLSYNKQVIGKLWFSANLNATYGKMQSEYKSLNIGAKMIPQIYTPYVPEPGNFYMGSVRKEDSRIFSVSLRPEFSYFLTDKIGLKISMGGIQYNSYDFEAHEWQITLNPSTWEYGFFLRFDKKK